MSGSRLLSAAAIVLLAYLVFLIARPFATPLVFALVMVVIFQPAHVRFERRLSPSLAAALSTAVVVLAIIVPAALIASRIVAETIDVAGNVRAWSLDTIVERAQSNAARWGLDVERLIRDVSQQLAGRAGAALSRVIRDTWALLVGTAVAVVAMFFLFRDGAGLLQAVERACPFPARVTRSLIVEVAAMIRSNIAASLIAASIQGTIGGLAFAWLGLPAPVLWGVVMGFFCVFPVVGAWLVWAPAAAVLAAAGRAWDAAVLVIVGLALVHPVDNLLRPAVVARRTGLNGLLVLVGLLGGVQAFGVSGLLLGPAVLSIAIGLLRGFAREESRDGYRRAAHST